MHELCPTYEHVWMSFGTHMNESCHRYERERREFPLLTTFVLGLFMSVSRRKYK